MSIVIFPDKYLNEMKALLSDEEYQLFYDSYQQKGKRSIRINTSKITVDAFKCISPFTLEPIPWIENGFYVEDEAVLSKHPYYYAGYYYIQEASAMTPANLLQPRTGERVLDLCAAPGGKSTELASQIGRYGVLYANDISHSRAKALLKNLEMQGFGNIYVSSEIPANLATVFPEYFDRILVDAPCSGEGMFRKYPEMIKDWMEKGPDYYAEIQREILQQAAVMLKPGGVLSYSTCTFSRVEDEETILHFLEANKDFKILPIEKKEGFSDGILTDGTPMEGCIRLWPHKIGGEGHFVALLKKNDSEVALKRQEKASKKQKEIPEALREFLMLLSKCEYLRNCQFYSVESSWYAVSKEIKIPSGIRFLRTGLLLGNIEKKRFEPSQALASFLKKGEYDREVSLDVKDERVIRYLKGETIEVPEIDEKIKGWCLLLLGDTPIGWGKLQNGRLKNKFYPGWRML